MNRNSTAVILVILSIGIYFTFTSGQLAQARAIKAVNDEYSKAIDNAIALIRVRDNLLAQYKEVSEIDRINLDKMIPSTVDNIRLVIDLKDIAAKHGFALKNIKATAPVTQQGTVPSAPRIVNTSQIGASDITAPVLDTVTVSFTVTAPYLEFISFLQDLESNLRIMDITRLSLKTQDTGVYEFGVELKTYWLRQ
ncbi:MAG: putative pilO [Parcubacteria bacterium C7867-002]|nr:MAG: putative pilO [Parcubacteria bacterium C7867-002]